MRLSRFAAWTTVAAALAATVIVAPARAQQPPPSPKPGPEHEILKMDVGVWDAVVEINPGPGAPPMTSKGIETNTLGCGGLCLITDFKADMGGTEFHGHGLAAWNPVKKKYVNTWTDSMSAGVAVGEAAWNAKTRQMSGWMEGPDATGTVMKTRSVGEHKGATRVFTAYAPGPDGKEMQIMRITYTKRK